MEKQGIHLSNYQMKILWAQLRYTDELKLTLDFTPLLSPSSSFCPVVDNRRGKYKDSG